MYKATFFQKICCRFRHYYESLYPPNKHFLSCEKNPDCVSDIIYRWLINDGPCMIARFGSTELYCLANYLGTKKGCKESLIPFLFAKGEPWWMMSQRVSDLKNCSGFFSADKAGQVETFCELLLEDMKHIDVLGSWVCKEYLIEPYISHAKRIFLPYLEPYYAQNPWSRALQGKNVLVVHPFADQIKYQYETNRAHLFKDIRVLPDFNLITLRAIQSLCGEDNGFDTWFDALEYMKAEIDKVDYDICIIGCGAYGFHLAAHVKRSGKKSIHMGGATQLLFGIKGKRWEDPMYGVKEWGLPYSFYPDLFNDFWIRPGDNGRPKNAEKIEGACYW